LPPAQRMLAERTGIVPNPPAFPGGSAPFGGGKAPQEGEDENKPPTPPQAATEE
jgi:hypothetical protein